MKTEAAILFQTGAELRVEEIEIPDHLSSGQVLVRVITSGICGAQINEIDAVKGPDQFLPHLLGHEGYCEVLRISEDVTTVAVGDLAIMHWRPSQGIQSSTPKYLWNGKVVNAGWVTTFNRHSVVSENRLTKIDSQGFSREILPLLGCALTTSFGVITKEAGVKSEDKVIIFGAGGVGLSMLKILKSIQVEDVCVVDVSEEKIELARRFGAAHIVRFENKNQVADEIRAYFASGLPNVAFDTTGKVPCIELAYEQSDPQGLALLVGVPKFGEKSSIYTLPLHFGKRLIGSKGGGSIPDIDIPILMEKMKTGRLDFSDFPTRVYSLSEINSALNDLRSGRVGRMVIDMEIS